MTRFPFSSPGGSPGRRLRPTLLALAGTGLGVLAGVASISLVAAVAVGSSQVPVPDTIDGAHVPPLLTVPPEPVTLRYAIVCPPPGGDLDAGAACDGGGEVYARAGHSGSFTKLELRRGDDSREGRWFVELPSAIASASTGFSYYALLRNNATGTSMTLPAGGAAAPQRSFPLAGHVRLDLPQHTFGRVRRATQRVVSAPWGRRAGQAGLAGGKQVGYTGPSTFDITADGTIVLLDQVNGRLQRWQPGGGTPSTTPIQVSDAIAEMALGADGTVHVLQPAPAGQPPELRSFDASGSVVGQADLADRTWGALRAGPAGLEAQQLPSEQWMPVRSGGRALNRLAQRVGGHPGRSVAGGGEVVVLRGGSNELRLALVAGSRVLGGWRIVSATPLGEVQLAELLGNRLVIVVKTYTESDDEFVVFVLDQKGIAESFAVPSAQWAEAAALGRFQLHGSSLLQLGSTPSGLFIDRFDLGRQP